MESINISSTLTYCSCHLKTATEPADFIPSMLCCFGVLPRWWVATDGSVVGEWTQPIGVQSHNTGNMIGQGRIGASVRQSMAVRGDLRTLWVKTHTHKSRWRKSCTKAKTLSLFTTRYTVVSISVWTRRGQHVVPPVSVLNHPGSSLCFILSHRGGGTSGHKTFEMSFGLEKKGACLEHLNSKRLLGFSSLSIPHVFTTFCFFCPNRVIALVHIKRIFWSGEKTACQHFWEVEFVYRVFVLWGASVTVRLLLSSKTQQGFDSNWIYGSQKHVLAQLVLNRIILVCAEITWKRLAQVTVPLSSLRFQGTFTSLTLPVRAVMINPLWHFQDEYVLQSNRKIKLNKTRWQMTN